MVDAELILEEECHVQNEELAVNLIVEEWNKLATNIENTTISFAITVDRILKKYPEDSAKSIIKKVSEHPNIKRAVSVDRAWAGLRLIRNRPEVIEYANSTPEEKESMEKPVLKQDGNVNYEFYIELYKHKVDEGVRIALEEKAKEESWSYRRLLDEIRRAKDKTELNTEETRFEKSKLIREIAGILKSKPLSFIRQIREMLYGSNTQDISQTGTRDSNIENP